MTGASAYRARRGEFDLRGYEVVRGQFFASASIVSASFSRRGICFSRACIRSLAGIEYIELLVHPGSRCLAIRPCARDGKNALRWVCGSGDGLRGRAVSGAAFIGTLYELFHWNTEHRYRLRGEIQRLAGETVARFDARTPEIYAGHAMHMPWATGFGVEYYRMRTARLHGAAVCGTFAEYNSDPELRPTSPELAKEHARRLMEEMRSGGWDACD